MAATARESSGIGSKGNASEAERQRLVLADANIGAAKKNEQNALVAEGLLRLLNMGRLAGD